MGEALSVAMRLAITIISSTALAPVFQSGSLFFKQGRNARNSIRATHDPCEVTARLLKFAVFRAPARKGELSSHKFR